jgi:hypothetical protein
MSTAKLKYVTWKTAFLTLLASGARGSEVHALEYSSLKFHESFKYALLDTLPEFKAKTASRDSKSAQSSQIRIPALWSELDRKNNEDRMLCPVRALKAYRARTQFLRKNKNLRKLFVSIQPNKMDDIKKNTFSSWVKQLIRTTYETASEENIQVSGRTVHEIRALASSMAWRANLNLDHILQACNWKSHTTFTDFYLRDLTCVQDDLHSLGPLVAAQQVVEIPHT